MTLIPLKTNYIRLLRLTASSLQHFSAPQVPLLRVPPTPLIRAPAASAHISYLVYDSFFKLKPLEIYFFSPKSSTMHAKGCLSSISKCFIIVEDFSKIKRFRGYFVLTSSFLLFHIT